MNNRARQVSQRHRYYAVGRRLAQWVLLADLVYRRTRRTPGEIVAIVTKLRKQLEAEARVR